MEIKFMTIFFAFLAAVLVCANAALVPGRCPVVTVKDSLDAAKVRFNQHPWKLQQTKIDILSL